MADDVFGIVGTTQAGSFQVQEVVAEGGFGVVYRALHSGFRAPVALKCLKVPDAMTRREREHFLEKFREEGELMFRLSAAITEVVRPLQIDVLTPPDGRFVPFLALEWLEGETLDGIVAARREARKPPVGLVKAVKLLTPIARALARAHRFPGPTGPVSIVHRDLKPENIFVTSSAGVQGVKILDFGIAKAKKLAVQVAGRLTGQRPEEEEMMAFSPAYGSPEQWVPRRYGETGPWTDIWGLALTLVEVVIGRPAVEGEMFEMRFAALDTECRPTPGALGLAIAPEVEAVFTRALAVDPRERHQDVESFWSDLERSLGMPVSLEPRKSERPEELSALIPLSKLLPSGLDSVVPPSVGEAGKLPVPPGMPLLLEELGPPSQPGPASSPPARRSILPLPSEPPPSRRPGASARPRLPLPAEPPSSRPPSIGGRASSSSIPAAGRASSSSIPAAGRLSSSALPAAGRLSSSALPAMAAAAPVARARPGPPPLVRTPTAPAAAARASSPDAEPELPASTRRSVSPSFDLAEGQPASNRRASLPAMPAVEAPAASAPQRPAPPSPPAVDLAAPSAPAAPTPRSASVPSFDLAEVVRTSAPASRASSPSLEGAARAGAPDGPASFAASTPRPGAAPLAAQPPLRPALAPAPTMAVEMTLARPLRIRPQTMAPLADGNEAVERLKRRLRFPIQLLVLAMVIMAVDLVSTRVGNTSLMIGPVRPLWVAGPLAFIGAGLIVWRLLFGEHDDG